MICDVNSHLSFFTFSPFSPKFGKLFGELSFRQGGFSAKWLFGEVVFGKVSCIGYKINCAIKFAFGDHLRN